MPHGDELARSLSDKQLYLILTQESTFPVSGWGRSPCFFLHRRYGHRHKRSGRDMSQPKEVTMENRLEDKLETREEWITPELKKIDVEELTAGGLTGDDDGTTFS